MSDRSSERSANLNFTRNTRSVLLEQICRVGFVSRRELAKTTGIPLPTVHRLCTQLETDGLVIENHKADGHRGRPAKVIGINPLFHASQVIMVTDSSITGAVISINDSILYQHSLATIPKISSEKVVSTIINLVEALHNWCDQRAIPCEGIGVTVPGIVNINGEVSAAGELGWTKVPLKAILSTRFNEVIRIENNANTFAYGEYLSSEERKNPVVGYVMRKFGIGTGLICNGEILHGYHGAAGELGYVLTGLNSLHEYHLNSGDLEWHMANTGMEATDAMSQDLLLDLVALSIADVSSIIDPEVIIMDINGISPFEELVEGVNKRLIGKIPNIPNILQAKFGAHSSIIGTGELISRIFRESLFNGI